MQEVIKPKVFVGSSVEKLDIAYAIQTALDHVAQTTVWDQGVFTLSSNALDDLIKALDESDFGIFVFSPEDIVKIRDQQFLSVRDNVIFELGLFVGRLGKERTFFIVPRDQQNLHLPTDLLGINPATFDPNRSDGNLQAALGPASFQIRQRIQRLGLGKSQLEQPGELIRLQLLPQEFVNAMRPLLRRRELRCTYTVLEGHRISQEESAEIIPIKGGLFINVKGISRQAYIQLRASDGDQSWTSDFESIDSLGIHLKQDEPDGPKN